MVYGVGGGLEEVVPFEGLVGGGEQGWAEAGVGEVGVGRGGVAELGGEGVA